jgi:hypothetical protein
VVLIDVDRVRLLEAAGSYSELVLTSGTTELHDKPLGCTRVDDLRERLV